MTTPLVPGSEIGRYHIVKEIGRGGMGVVYQATDPQLNRPIALKLLASHLGSDEKAYARFQREAALVAALKHPGIALAYEFGEHEGRPFIAMEWIDGVDLKSHLAENGRLPYADALDIARQLVDALDYAHRRGVIHRDLKPANIMISDDNHVTIVDFGLAWLDDLPSLTLSGSIVGTPLYLAPEQITGQPLDGRSDLYSIAVIIYELFAGQSPFAGGTTQAVFHQQLSVTPPPVTEYAPNTPLQVEAALVQGLAKDPDDRFSSGAELYAALTGDTTRSQVMQLPTEPQPQRALWMLAGAFAAIGIVLLGLWIAQRYQPDEQLAGVVSPTVTVTSSLPATAAPMAQPSPTPTAELEAIIAISDAAGDDTTIFETITTAVETTADDLVVIPEPASYPDTDSGWIQAGNAPVYDNWVGRLPLIVEEPRWTKGYTGPAGAGVVAGQELVLFTAENELVAFNWEGENGDYEPEWVVELGAPISLPPILNFWDDEYAKVYIITEDNQLYALSAFDRAFLWSVGPDVLGDVPLVGVTYDGSMLHILDELGTLYIIEGWGGTLERTYQFGDGTGRYEHAVTIIPDLILGIDSDGTLDAVDSESGDTLWTTELGIRPIQPIFGTWDGGTIYAIAESTIVALGQTKATERWRVEIDGQLVGVTATWSYLVGATADGTLHGWPRNDNAVEWEYDMETTVSVPPYSDGERIIVLDDFGKICLMVFDDGKRQVIIESHIETGGPIDESPAFVDGWLFVRNIDSLQAYAPILEN